MNLTTSTHISVLQGWVKQRSKQFLTVLYLTTLRRKASPPSVHGRFQNLADNFKEKHSTTLWWKISISIKAYRHILICHDSNIWEYSNVYKLMGMFPYVLKKSHILHMGCFTKMSHIISFLIRLIYKYSHALTYGNVSIRLHMRVFPYNYMREHCHTKSYGSIPIFQA